MKETEYTCDCNAIHKESVDIALKKMPEEVLQIEPMVKKIVITMVVDIKMITM